MPGWAVGRSDLISEAAKPARVQIRNMSDAEPDYTDLSWKDLVDVADHIDRDRFPDRWNRLKQEITARKARRRSAVSTNGASSSESWSASSSIPRIPAQPASNRPAIIIIAILFISALGFTAWGAIMVFQTHFWQGPDVQFGDQHLKTAVALIELHRLRFGRYPERLSDLQFKGDWDPIAINSVSYRANQARTHYCVQVERGWIAKPHLKLPPEFWRGTGYDPALCR
jgi:hypothetical protein